MGVHDDFVRQFLAVPRDCGRQHILRRLGDSLGNISVWQLWHNDVEEFPWVGPHCGEDLLFVVAFLCPWEPPFVLVDLEEGNAVPSISNCAMQCMR